MEKIKIGLIGGGYWGKNYLRLLNEMQCFDFTCFVDVSIDMLSNTNKKYPHLFTSTDPKDIIDKVDCVVIATPVPTHYPLGKMFIENKKHVLIEKPLAESTEHAVALVELSKKNNVILMVGYTVLYTSGITYLKKYLEDTHAKIFYMMTKRGNLGIIRNDCDVVYDLMCHDIAIIFYLIENCNVNELHSFSSSYVSENTNDVSFTLMKINDIIISSYTSWLDSDKSRAIDIVTDSYKIIYDDTNQLEPIKIFNKSLKNKDGEICKNDTNIVIPTIQWREPLRCQCEHFYDCVVNNIEPLSGGNFAVSINKLLELITNIN
jgi:predicted dehydrogenase